MTTIGPSIAITGEVTSTEDIVVQGRVHGQVNVREGLLTIGEQAQLRADVRGARVMVLGQLKGSIVASERIELAPTASVEGTLSADRVVLTDGTRFNGSIDMGQRTLAARVAQFKATQGAVATLK